MANYIDLPILGSTANGTVTSVGLSLPNIFTVSNTPVTTNGTLTGTLAAQADNKVFASSASGGGNTTPAFRALLSADIPAINLATSGNGGVTGNLPFLNTQQRQVVVSTSTSANGTATSAAFNAFTNAPILTFTALNTAKYEVFGNFGMSCGSLAATMGMSVVSTSGTPTYFANQESYADAFVINDNVAFSPWAIFNLNANQAYTFTVYGKSTAGTLTLKNSLPTSGSSLIAQQIS